MKNLIMLLLLGLSPGLLAAQDDQAVPDNDQIRAQRGAYITQRLQLSSQEAAHFWTVFNEYEERKATINEEFRQSVVRPRTEAEAEQRIQRRFQQEADLLNLKREFFARLKEKVPATKLVMIPQAEREFRRNLLRQLRQRRQSGNRN